MKANPGGKLRAVCWLLAGIFFAYDLAVWGGLAATPKLGEQLRHDASLHSPLAATYLGAGGFVVAKAGREDQARAFAASRFLNLPSPEETDRRHALADVLAAQSSFGDLAYYGAPLLGLLSLALHVGRQKPIRSFGGRG
jgi:hypothetical protein